MNRTLGALPTQELELLSNMKLFVSQLGNYKHYRARLAHSRGPTSPYLGTYLTDLTYIKDGNPLHVPDRDDLINFSKLKLFGTILEQVISFQVRHPPNSSKLYSSSTSPS